MAVAIFAVDTVVNIDFRSILSHDAVIGICSCVCVRDGYQQGNSCTSSDNS